MSTLLSVHRHAKIFIGTCFVLVCLYAMPLHAQEQGFTLTVTPPLFQLGLQPGEVWSSSIQIVNSNPYDITVVAEPTLFRPSGESGRPEFYLPGSDEVAPLSSLAEWITVPRQAISIRREQTYQLPVVIQVPDDAAPGGHYAAILIGNKPPEVSAEGGTVSVTSSIAALVFLRVSGEVSESGRIRAFSTEQSIYQEPNARFTLRFENQGNVHLQPQGDITIYNMFGKNRGYIPINQGNGGYGNVLPESVREFTFVWDSGAGLWDIGRYRAEATLGYGEGTKQFVSSAVYFYVLPFKPLLEIMAGIIALLVSIGWALRLYVRRALALEQARVQVRDSRTTPPEVPYQAQPAYRVEPKLSLTVLARPIQTGMVDLRRVAAPGVAPTTHDNTNQQMIVEPFSPSAFMREYRMFFIFVGISAAGWFAISAYFEDVLTYERPYTAVEERADGNIIPLEDVNSDVVD